MFYPAGAPVAAIPHWRSTVLARALALGYRIRRAVEVQEVLAIFSGAARQMQVSLQRVSNYLKVPYQFAVLCDIIEY